MFEVLNKKKKEKNNNQNFKNIIFWLKINFKFIYRNKFY